MDDSKKKIIAKNVTKRFELETSRKTQIKQLFTPSKQKVSNSFWSLKGVSFDISPGEAIGVVGLNGSGKSTLLNIVSGIYPQTTGSIEINGDTSIISIGAGLKENLSGRDNIDFKLLMMGFNNQQIKDLAPDIIKFSELGDFIDQPVKSYSSGMKSKLGFSIMAFTDPDIMIIDEALSVGDSTFAKKSFDKIRQFKAEGKTIFFVSHSNTQVKEIADKIIWMHYGELREVGPTAEILPHYTKWQKEFNALPRAEREAYMNKQKQLQREFSLEDIAEEELQTELDSENPNEQLIASRKARSDYVKKTVKKLGKRAKTVSFGLTNWLITIALVALIGYTTYQTITEAQTKRNQTTQKSVKRASERKLSEKKHAQAKKNAAKRKKAAELSRASISSKSENDTNQDLTGANTTADSTAASDDGTQNNQDVTAQATESTDQSTGAEMQTNDGQNDAGSTAEN